MGWQENKLKYTNEYNRKKYDRILLSVPKGLKEKIKSAAESDGKTMTAYILAAVEKEISQKK